MSTGTGRLPSRVCIVANHNPYAERRGSAEYLTHLAASLKRLGAELHLLVLQGPADHQIRIRMVEALVSPFDSIRVRSAIRHGTRFYARDPRRWLRRLQRRELPPRPKLWRLDRPSRESLSWAGERIRQLKPDLVVANRFNAAEVFGAAPPDVPKVILTHDVLSLRVQSLAAAGLDLDFEPDMLPREAEAFARADLCLAIKPEEAEHIAHLAPETRVAVFPFAVDVEEDDLSGPRPPVALFVGSNNSPNRDGLRWLLGEVWPLVRAARPDVRLRVVGRVCETPDLTWPEGTEPVGFAEDLGREYARASVALTPLRYGSGVKIKLVEGLGRGLPGVATTVGAEGVVRPPEAVLRVADDAAGFATAILAALADPEAAAVRAAAREFARRHFSRESVTRDLGSALSELLGASRHGA